MKSQVDVYLRINVDMVTERNGRKHFQSSYLVIDWKPNSFFDPKKSKEAHFIFHHKFDFKQKDYLQSLPLHEQEEIKTNCAKGVEEEFLKHYPKHIPPLCH